MSTFNITPQSVAAWTALDGIFQGEAIQAADGWWTSSVTNADGATLPVAGERRETLEAAIAYAVAAALDSDLADPFDMPQITSTMLDLVEAVTATYGGHENTGGGTMCAVWTKGDVTAVMGNDDTTVALYGTSAWYDRAGSEHFAFASDDDDSFTAALRAVIRFLEWA